MLESHRSSNAASSEINIDQIGASNKAGVFIVPFSHLDLFWAGTRSECLSRGTQIIDTALDLLERYPEYRFMVESANFMEYYIECYPDKKSIVADFIESGRLEVIPVRAIIYSQLPAGETTVRNLLYGREFYKNEFNVTSKVMSMSDIPGVIPQIAQIAKKTGIEILFLSHGCPPHTDYILYEAPDGTSIQGYAPLHYGKCRHLLADGLNFEKMLEGEDEFEKYFDQVDYSQLCQWGLDLCIIREETLAFIDRWNKEGHRKITYTTIKDFFDNHLPPAPKTIKGEIPSLWPNIESSWPDLWPLDIPVENALHTAEYFASLAIYLGMKDSTKKIRHEAWINYIDSIDHNQNGVGGLPADADKRETKLTAKAMAEIAAKRQAWTVATRIAPSRKGAFPIVVFNSLGWKRSEIVTARTALYGKDNPQYKHPSKESLRLIDASGLEVPFRTVCRMKGMADSCEVEFIAQDIPAFGYRIYYIEGEKFENCQSPFVVSLLQDRDLNESSCRAGTDHFENDLFRLEADCVTGQISLLDKKSNCYLFNKASIQATEEVRGDYICNMDLSGRVIPATCQKIELVQNDAVACKVCIRGSVYGMNYTQTITIPAELPYIDIDNHIDWCVGNYVRIEQKFPIDNFAKSSISYGTPFGTIQYPETIYANGLDFKDVVTPERGENPDDKITKIRLTRWVSAEGCDAGVEIASDHRMWEFGEDSFINCMIRGIGFTSGGREIIEGGKTKAVKRPPMGTYSAHFRISPKDTAGNKIGKLSEELCSPFYSVGVGVDSKKFSSATLHIPQLPNSSDTGIVLNTLKPAEQQTDSVIFRGFECAGKTSELLLPEIEGWSWFETDMKEEQPFTVSGKVKFTPFEIKTLMSVKTVL